MQFIHLCQTCQLKSKKARKHLVVKPIVSNDFNHRCQMDLIDMQSSPDGDFKHILVYQDHLSEFVQLRPLKSKSSEKVADHLDQILCILGAPRILQTDNGREFCNTNIQNVLQKWPDCKFVHGKPRQSQSQGSVERANQDVENMLFAWMRDNKTTHWSKGN